MSLLMPWNSWPAEGLTELAHPEVDPRPPVLSAGSGPVDKGKLSRRDCCAPTCRLCGEASRLAEKNRRTPGWRRTDPSAQNRMAAQRR